MMLRELEKLVKEKGPKDNPLLREFLEGVQRLRKDKSLQISLFQRVGFTVLLVFPAIYYTREYYLGNVVYKKAEEDCLRLLMSRNENKNAKKIFGDPTLERG